MLGLVLGLGSLPPDFANKCAKSLALVFHTVFAGILLDHSSLPPDFASRLVKSLALAFTQHLHAFCSLTAHFRQILPTYV